MIFSLSCTKLEQGLEILEQQRISQTSQARIGLALGLRGLGDNSFNDMQYTGMVIAQTVLPVRCFVRAPSNNSPESLEQLFIELIELDRCELVIVAESYVMKEAVLEIAKANPAIKFVLMDHEAVPLSNIIASQFKQNEVGYSAGFLAARLSGDRPVGFIGGVDLWSVRDFLAGFENGVHDAKTGSPLRIEFLSRVPDFSGFSVPEQAFQLAETMYQDGVRIIAAVAGASGTGVIEAARKNARLAIGVDSNQDSLAPGHVLTSMVKRVDVAITNFIAWHLARTLEGGQAYHFGYSVGGVGLTDFEYTREKIPTQILAELQEIELKLARGEITPESAILDLAQVN